MKSHIGVVAFAGSLLCGCTTLPVFTGPPGFSLGANSHAELSRRGPVPTVYDVVQHIQCEIWSLPRPPVEGQPETAEQKAIERLWKYQYVVYAILTVDVTDDGQLHPSIDFIQPLAASGTLRSLLLSPAFGGTAHRNITLTFVLDLDPKGDPIFDPGKQPSGIPSTLDQYCAAQRRRPGGIEGDLGIKNIIAEGLKYSEDGDFVFPLAISSDQTSTLPLGAPSDRPGFGTTVDFTLTYGLGGGPNWSLTHFNGPGESGPLLNYTRTRKDTLVLSFAAAQQRPIAAAKDKLYTGNAAATAIARSNATLSLLQHILPVR